MRAWTLVGILCGAAIAAGCAGTGVSRTDAMMDRLEEVGRISASARADIDRASSTLTSIVDGGGADPRPKFEQFRGELGAVSSARAGVDSAGAAFRSAMEAHFAAWERDANAMQNPEIRAASMKRRDEARAKMGSLEPALAEVASTFDPYLSNLRDIEKLLGADLSPGGVSAAAKTVRKATDEAVRTKRALQALEDAAGRIREELSVRRPEPEGAAGENAPQ